MIRIFRHYIPKSLFYLGTIEALILLFSIYLGVTLRLWMVDSGATGVVEGPLLPKALLFAFVMICVMMAMGLYQRDLRENMRSVILRIGVSFLLGLVFMTMFLYALPPVVVVDSGPMGLALSSAFFGIVLTRYMFFKVTAGDRFKQRIIVLGTGKSACQIQSLKRRSDWRGMNFIGFVEVGELDPRINRKKLLPMKSSLIDLVERYEIDEIVVALDDRRSNLPIEEILECKMKGVEVIDAATFFERRTGKISLDSLRPSTMIFSDGYSNVMAKMTSKRIFDVIVSFLILIPSVPIMLFTALAIAIECGGRGPILYRQIRVGKGGRHFELLKFRSMKVDAEAAGAPKWAQQNDNRITVTGRLIRVLRIDELPQLLNVFRGDMSFIGPRPERPTFVEQLEQHIPYYAMRHRVNPGITGWAQVCYPYGASVEDARQKLQYDLYYIKNYSLFLDFTVLFQTAQVIVWGKGAR